MTINPHPYVLMTAAAQRQADVLARCERDRRARLARERDHPRSDRVDRLTMRTVDGMRALLLAIARQRSSLGSLGMSCR
jgi:hypothetical protein